MLVLLRKYWLSDVTWVTLLTLRLLLRRWAIGTRAVLLLARVCWWMDLGYVREVLKLWIHGTDVYVCPEATYDFLTVLGIRIGVRLNNAGFAHIRSRDASVTT